MRFLLAALIVVSIGVPVSAQLPGGGTGGIFGTVVPLVGGAADIVLDESHGRLYLVNSSLSRIEVYSLAQRRFVAPIATKALPLAAAISRNGRWLYVACFDGAALDVIDLDSMQASRSIALPAKPEGVAVGRNERVLISTIGTGTNNLSNVLLLYDPADVATVSLSPVAVTPPAPQNPLLPATSGRIFLASRSQLTASADGSLIAGVNIANNTSRSVFVFEVASGTVLRSRTMLNVSSVLSISPDNSRMMTGLSLLDTGTLEILAQQNTANSPYPFAQGVNFNTQQNQGGSVFSPDGATLYAAFNTAPVQNPAARANVSELMLNDPDNLLIRMGLKVTENLAGKMVIGSDGANIYALSESGFVILPVGTLRQSPLAAPETRAVVLANDQCGVTAGQRRATVPMRNEGNGRFTVQASLLQTTPTGGAALGGPGGAGGGAIGGGVVIILPPAPGGAVPLPGGIAPGGARPDATPPVNNAVSAAAPQVRATNAADGPQLEFTYTSAASGRQPGTVSPTHTYVLQSSEAVNIPPSIRVFQNFRDSEARADVVPVEVGTTANEALEDMVLDTQRNRIYIANSGMNRVEVFDTRNRRLMNPIKVGQLPRSISLSPDGNTLYAANTGGENISVIDLDKGAVVDRIHFPPLPFNSNAALVTPSIVAAGQRGPMIIMSNGTIWRVVGNTAVPRAQSTLIGATTLPAPRTMAATPGGEYILVLAGTGNVYLYDSQADEFVQSRQVFTNPIQGFYGPVAAGARGQYYLVNGTILNQALTPTANAGTVPSGQNTVGRPVSAVATGSGNMFVRFVQPVRTNNNAPSEPANVEMVNFQTGALMRSAAALEGPISAQVGTQRVNVNGRTMAVDADGSTAYAITTSGISIVPMEPVNPADRPLPNNGGIVNLTSYLTNFAPGGLISIFGRNLAGDGAISSSTAPTVMGDVCVTYNNNPLPLLMTSAEQINAQIPPETAAGRGTVIVRNLNRKAASLTQSITVTKYAPSIFTNPQTGLSAIFHSDGTVVSKDRPAKRDERLTLYATGLGATKGGQVVSGQAAPSSPLAETEPVTVYFGDPSYKQAEIIVEWSGLVPGFIGVYQVNLRVPGDRMRGDSLPVTLRIGGAESQKTGPAVPLVAVE